MALRCGGCCAAARHCSPAYAEMPTMPDITVAPGLLGDPFDEIVVVPPVIAHRAFRLPHAAQLGDDVDVAVRDEAAAVPGLDDAVPNGAPRRLRIQRFGQLGPLKVLVVPRAAIERGEPARRIGTVDIQGYPDAVPHRHHHVSVLLHALVHAGLHSSNPHGSPTADGPRRVPGPIAKATRSAPHSARYHLGPRTRVYRYTVLPATYFGGMYGTSRYESYLPPVWIT